MPIMDWAGLELSLAESLSERTVRQTITRLRFIETNGGLVSEESFRAFYIAQKRLGLSIATLNKYVQSIAHYCRYTASQWTLPTYKKEYAKRRQTYSDDEINQILELGVLKREHFTVPIILELLAYSGARPSEILLLAQEQIDWQNCGLTIAGTKTGNDRFIPIPPHTLEKLRTLPDPLFKGSTMMVVYALKRRCELLSIPYRPTYSLRHSRISSWISSKIDLPTVSDLAGNSVEVIMRHYWHTSVTHLQASIKKDTLRRSQMKPDEKVREIAKLLEEVKNSFKLDEDQDLDVHLDQKTNQISFTVKVKKETKKSK